MFKTTAFGERVRIGSLRWLGPLVVALWTMTASASDRSLNAIQGLKPAERSALPTDGELFVIAAEPEGSSRRTYFINGAGMTAERSVRAARAIQRRIGGGLTLGFVDAADIEVDWLAMTVSKLGDYDTELQPVASALRGAIEMDLAAGRTVRLIGYSLGGILIQNVVNKVGAELTGTPEAGRLRSIQVMLVGAAVFANDHPLSDGWPRDVRVFSVSDAGDAVAQIAGDVDDDWIEASLERHSLEGNYLRHLHDGMLGMSGRLVTNGAEILLEEIHDAKDPADRVIRWLVWDIPGEESRRTINARLPAGWERLGWSVEASGDVEAVRFTLMQDVSFGFDEAVIEDLQHGRLTGHGDGHYLGRVRGVDARRKVRVSVRPGA